MGFCRGCRETQPAIVCDYHEDDDEDDDAAFYDERIFASIRTNYCRRIGSAIRRGGVAAVG